jgi:2-oxoglutarate ferredoxin oxidoreductase subunit beta
VQSKLTPRGTGIRPFQPAGLALTAGASFIARGFTGDPNGLAKILVEAIRHPGFSFVQALSPCPTFRPEQMQWKRQVRGFEQEPTEDPVEAGRRIQSDDGMSTGIVYQALHPVLRPGGDGGGSLDAIEQEFRL